MMHIYGLKEGGHYGEFFEVVGDAGGSGRGRIGVQLQVREIVFERDV